MDPFFLMLLFSLAVVVPGTLLSVKSFWEKFSSCQIQIDAAKYPTLHRAQRIVYANNTAMRELEHEVSQNKALEAIDIKSKEVDKAIWDIELEGKSKRADERMDWSREYNILISAEEERKRKEQEAENQRLREESLRKREQEDKEAQERRQKELAEWAATEFERQKALAPTKAELETKQKANREWFIQKTSRQEESNESYGDRKIIVHAANIRQKPDTNSRIIGRLDQYQKVTVTQWTIGDELYGNSIWFRIQGIPGVTSTGWIWSGALNKQTTSGLQRVEPKDSETVTLKNASGETIREIEVTPANPLSQDEVDFVHHLQQIMKRI